MNINKDGKEYTIEERVEYWIVSNKDGTLTVEYKIPKDICKSKEELSEYVKKQDLF